jgi:hypothetical protein
MTQFDQGENIGGRRCELPQSINVDGQSPSADVTAI